MESFNPKEKPTFTCCFCKVDSYGPNWGNNPEPMAKEGRCCDICNSAVVIPARMMRAFNPDRFYHLKLHNAIKMKKLQRTKKK